MGTAVQPKIREESCELEGKPYVQLSSLRGMFFGFDEAVRMGVPEEAAWEFLSGHARIEFGIIFGFAGFPFSDGAKLAIANAYEKIFKPDWKERIMDKEAIQQSVREITGLA